jgi:hypothetical protein
MSNQEQPFSASPDADCTTFSEKELLQIKLAPELSKFPARSPCKGRTPFNPATQAAYAIA